MSERIANAALRQKVMSADDAASLIKDGDQIGFGGFTGSGYPKVFPGALAKRIEAAHQRGEKFTVNTLTGASTAPELDGALAGVDGIGWRMPYQSDPTMRSKINDGTSYYTDIHLSESGMMVRQGFFGKIDFAVIEATRITEDGKIVPTSSVGNNSAYCEVADKIIIEVNSWQSEDLAGEGIDGIDGAGEPGALQVVQDGVAELPRVAGRADDGDDPEAEEGVQTWLRSAAGLGHVSPRRSWAGAMTLS